MPRLKRIPIEDVMVKLASGGATSEATTGTLICDLVAWMHSPERGKYQRFVSDLLRLRYLAEMSDDELHAKTLVEFARTTRFGFIADVDMLSDYSMDPVYGPHAMERLEYVAQIVRFVVSYQPEAANSKTAAPSLGKAQFALNEGIYGRRWNVTEKWADEVWRDFKRSAPFIAANALGSRGALTIDPSDRDLLKKFHRLSIEPRTLLRWMGQAKWLQRRLRETLYPLVFARVRPINFPGSVEEVAIHFTPTTKQERQLMQSYRAGSY